MVADDGQGLTQSHPARHRVHANVLLNRRAIHSAFVSDIESISSSLISISDVAIFYTTSKRVIWNVNGLYVSFYAFKLCE